LYTVFDAVGPTGVGHGKQEGGAHARSAPHFRPFSPSADGQPPPFIQVLICTAIGSYLGVLEFNYSCSYPVATISRPNEARDARNESALIP
jgi:hypothetical protein